MAYFEYFKLLTNSSGILYASTALNGEAGSHLLQKAIDALLSSVDDSSPSSVLLSVRYEQQASSGSDSLPTGAHVLRFPAPSLDLAFDDTVLENVKEFWQKVVGDDAGEFLVFQDRESYADDEES